MGQPTWSLGLPETAEQRFQGLIAPSRVSRVGPQVSAAEPSRCDELEADHPACAGLRTSMQSTPGADNWATRPGAVVRDLCSEPSEPPQIVRGFRDHRGCARIECMPLSTRGAPQEAADLAEQLGGAGERAVTSWLRRQGRTGSVPPHEQSGSAWRTRSMSSAAKG